MNRVVFSSLHPNWSTPRAVYNKLDEEFCFDDDPCPEGGLFGLDRKWGRSVYVNPPYGRWVHEWIEKAARHSQDGGTVVMLLPARTDTRWFHDLVLPHAKEIRLVRGRLKFGAAKTNAPFPSMVIVFKGATP